jgi:hypothetical protein
MPATLELDNGEHITYESAIKKDKNIINELTYPRARKQLFQKLRDQRATIQDIVRHQLGLRSEDSCILEDQWIRGSFNVCIPVEVRSAGFNQKLMFRCPMPHKLAEATYPGTIDEKLSAEVGAYVWMHEYCPDIPLPQLYGFGFSDNRHVSFSYYLQILANTMACTVYTRKTDAFLFPLLAHVSAITPRVPSIPNSVSICSQSNWRELAYCIYAV